MRNKYFIKEGQEELNRALLMMKYDSNKTLTENEELIKTLIKEDVEDSVKTVLSACATRGSGEGTLNAAEVAAGFNKAFNYSSLGIFGGTDDSKETGWRKYAETMKSGNLDDLCNISNRFKDAGYGDFAEKIISELDDEEMSELVGVFDMMKYRTDKEAKLSVSNTQQMNINYWRNQFPCVFENGDNVDNSPRKDRNNSVYILIKGSSGTQYQLYDGGSGIGKLKRQGEEKLLPQRLVCRNNQTIVESLNKKKLINEFDDSKVVGGKGCSGQKGGGQKGSGQKSQYNRSVTDTQQKLYNLGFYSGNSGPENNGVDGLLGPKTKSAETAWKNGDTCAVYNKRMNYPNPPTCKTAESEKPKTPVADKEISVVDPTND